MNRRSFLAGLAITPTAVLPGGLPNQQDGGTSTSVPLVKESVLPDGFEPSHISGPAPFARTLMAADDRFTESDFALAGFTEGPDRSNPRYTVATMAVPLPWTGSYTTVQNQFVDAFEAMMTEYDGLPGSHWTRQQKQTERPQSISLHGYFQTDRDTIADVDWLRPTPAPQFSEHWGLTASNHSAILVVVFGYRHGPWKPRTLFERTTDHIRQPLQNRR